MDKIGRVSLDFQQNFFKYQAETFKMMGQGIYSSWKGNDGINRWWPKWGEVVIPGYGNYGGPFRTDLAFRIPPQNSMDRLFMKHDLGWSQALGRAVDKKILSDLYGLPSNPKHWNEPPMSSWQATTYRRFVAEPYFWWRNLTLQDDN